MWWSFNPTNGVPTLSIRRRVCMHWCSAWLRTAQPLPQASLSSSEMITHDRHCRYLDQVGALAARLMLPHPSELQCTKAMINACSAPALTLILLYVHTRLPGQGGGRNTKWCMSCASQSKHCHATEVASHIDIYSTQRRLNEIVTAYHRQMPHQESSAFAAGG